MAKLETLKTSPDIIRSLLNYTASKPGPSRKLSLETEFPKTFMKLILGLLKQDLAFRFSILAGKISQIFKSKIKLLSNELGALIIWPSKEHVKKTLIKCFKKSLP